ncbi:hypothetical protein COCC4DRAFT_31938 [Bipolaris maydis ATCC 48331]|uniref:Uncharacterized protein n=2 Tax=Cochliobolus heterostrophus TaxID=5016 RepID=M2ULT6_COCH5|nr:uncharacterized protein COCC4DRAFT_31938 [Bipolaris maydis ATCC 48331]EMD88908.1 hypothetical protein COCHEDRAFT_1023090 [Bipolaris maydis C5]ENI05376.1 hypothetical protein COCC4DRAFT_31938 [Bipolaris maydis ATCC 48331]
MSDESAKREKKNQKTGLVKQMLDERWKKTNQPSIKNCNAPMPRAHATVAEPLEKAE